MTRTSKSFAMMALLALGTASGNAQGDLSLKVGGEVLIPFGSYAMPGTGFGGGLGLQYNLGRQWSLGLQAGYHAWPVKGGTFVNWPISASLKYYFAPPNAFRMYGLMEIGYSIKTITNELTIAPGLGMEIPVAGGRTALDFSARYERHLNASQISGINVRAGVLFGF